MIHTHRLVPPKQRNWNDLGYFEEGMPIKVNWLKHFLAAYEELDWDVKEIHSDLKVSKLLEAEVVDRGVLTRLLTYGYKTAGFAFPMMLTKLANWTALGEIGWMMLTAPTLRHAMGTLQLAIPLVDTHCHIQTTDDKDRFIMLVEYDINDSRHRECSGLIFASALTKFVNSFHGKVVRGDALKVRANSKTVNTAILQEVFWVPITNHHNARFLEISFDADFASKRNMNYDKRPWQNSVKAMRQMFGATNTDDDKASRYVQLTNMFVSNWNYQRDGKPEMRHLLRDLKISERGLRNLLVKAGTKPKDVMMKAEARRIYLSIKRGHSMTEAAEIYHWSNVTNMKKMVSDYLGKDLKNVKPFDYQEN